MTLRIKNTSTRVVVVAGLNNLKIAGNATVDAPEGFTEAQLVSAVAPHTELLLLGGTIMTMYTFDADGNSIVDESDDAIKLEGHSSAYFATSEELASLDSVVGGLSDSLVGLQEDLDSLQGQANNTQDDVNTLVSIVGGLSDVYLAKNEVSGTFTTVDNKTITITNGQVESIVENI